MLLFSIAALASGQQSESAPIAPAPAAPPLVLDMPAASDTDRMPDPNQGLIRVDFTITNEAGKTVSGLSEKDFKLLDNDQQQKIVTFQPFDGAVTQPADSLEIVFVIDELNMLPSAQIGRRELSEAAREVETFLRANGGVLDKPAIIYRLTAEGLFASPHASMDGNELAEEIANPSAQRQIWSRSTISKDIGHIGIGGDVSARISQSLVALGSIAIEERRKTGRKLLFWIGNGWQIEGRKAAGLFDFSIELLTRMREARINLWGASEWPLYDASGNAIPVTDYTYKEFLEGPKADSTDLSYLALPVIAARSGGGMLDAPRNLAGKIGERVKEEGNYYSLTFDPPRTSAIDEYHHLKIETNASGLSSHVFEDYYDEPVFYDQPPATKPVSVKQLEKMIANARDTSGSELAHQFDGLQLTERLSTAKLAEFAKQVRGRKAREALEVLADESVFLALPPDEAPGIAPPDIETQRQIISRTVSYVKTTIPRLPDFFATRTTVQYHEYAPKREGSWKTGGPDQSLHEGETATATIRFHDGKERVENESVKNTFRPGSEQLRTIGTFGPILATVMVAATSRQSELAWSRWEQAPTGPVAVFRYRVPQETNYFTAEYCCLAYDFDSVPFKKPAPFHGEIAVDPQSGAILRLTIQADLGWRSPLIRSDVMVEYRPIQRDSRAFVCPAKSVSISRQRRTVTIEEWGEAFKVYAPYETLLNEMRFEKYHIFGSTSRILPGFTEVPDVK